MPTIALHLNLTGGSNMIRFNSLLSLGLVMACGLAVASPADATVFCARKNAKTGTFTEGTLIHLRTTCRTTEITLPFSIEDSGATVRFTGVNVQIVSGSGATDGAVNGMGNLIVGYNEPRGGGNTRTGSHNVVVGTQNNFSRFGGIVVGKFNEIGGDYASVLAGNQNTASNRYSSVSGGENNVASGTASSVSGGNAVTQSANDGWAAGSIGTLQTGKFASQ
jgi:hypothetical protein